MADANASTPPAANDAPAGPQPAPAAAGPDAQAGAAPNEAVPNEAVPEEAAPKEAVPEEAAAKEAVPEEAAAKEAVPNEAAAKEAVPDEVVPKAEAPQAAAAAAAQPAAPDTLTIDVRTQDGTGSTLFKVKRTTKLDKVFKAFCNAHGMERPVYRFLFDGSNLLGDETPGDLDMQDGDSIDCVIAQVGGGM